MFSGAGSNPPLLPEGIDRAARSAKLLENVQFDAVFCSPQLRCRQTLGEVARLNSSATKFTTDPALLELHFGDFEGRTFDLSDPEADVGLREYYKNWPNITYNGGDNCADYYSKAIATGRKYAEMSGTILLVTHSGFIGSVLSGLCGGDISKMFGLTVPPASLFKLSKQCDGFCFERLDSEKNIGE